MVGEGSGVGSAAGPPMRCSLKVVSMGTGAKRLRAGAGSAMVSAVEDVGNRSAEAESGGFVVW